MDKWLEGLEPMVERQDLKVPYRYSMGATTSKFFMEIRDNRKIMGIRCPQCQVVFVPPRSTCGRCFSQLQEWVEVGNQGALETFTQVHYSTPVQPAMAPFYYGVIKLDGADTGLAHLVGELNGKRPRIGMRLQAVFREDRAGNMLDILHFKPVEEKGIGRREQGLGLKKRSETGEFTKDEGAKTAKGKTKGAKAKAKKAKGQIGRKTGSQRKGSRQKAKARK